MLIHRISQIALHITFFFRVGDLVSQDALICSLHNVPSLERVMLVTKRPRDWDHVVALWLLYKMLFWTILFTQLKLLERGPGARLMERGSWMFTLTARIKQMLKLELLPTLMFTASLPTNKFNSSLLRKRNSKNKTSIYKSFTDSCGQDLINDIINLDVMV